MPPAKPAFPNDQLPSTRLPGSAEIEAMVARTAPAILTLLADGLPRSKRVIAEALAGAHPKDDVLRTLMRLAVTGGVDQIGGKYTLGAQGEHADDEPGKPGPACPWRPWSSSPRSQRR